MKKTQINQNSWNNIAKSILAKGTDVDRAMDWMEKTFELVDDETLVQHNMELAVEKGLIKPEPTE